MTFDFVSYIVQQVEQQHANLFVEEGKEQKSAFIKHLVALQLAKLIELEQVNAEEIYSLIQQQQHQWLAQAVAQQTSQLEYFQNIQAKLVDANDKVANIIIGELNQLDQNANLGQAGVQELLDGQYHWMQDQVQDWFWDSIGQPQYKVTETPTEDPAEFQHVMKEFSQMMQQQAKHMQETSNKHHEPEPFILPLVAPFYRAVNPIIALLIIIGLFSTVF